MNTLTVNLVVHNGEEYIPFLIESLQNQTYRDFDLVVVDNGSTDKTLMLLETGLAKAGINYELIQNSENLGFACGHNQAYRAVKTPYFAILNVDMYLAPKVFEGLVGFIEKHSDTAAVAPRLMRWNFDKVSEGGASVGFTDQIDAIGIRLFRNRRAVEWLTRQLWLKDSDSNDVREIFNKPVIEVFGVSGAFSLYRKSVIDKILLPGNNLFDPTYHSYKEDLDLAYRLRNAGYVSYVLLDTVAYHNRSGAGPKKMGDWAAIKNKKEQSFFVSYHSYTNHLRTLYKNEYWENIIRDWPYIFWYEFKKFIYFLFTEPKLIFSSWFQIIRQRAYTKSARAAIIKNRRLHWQGIRRWFLL